MVAAGGAREEVCGASRAPVVVGVSAVGTLDQEVLSDSGVDVGEVVVSVAFGGSEVVVAAAATVSLVVAALQSEVGAEGSAVVGATWTRGEVGKAGGVVAVGETRGISSVVAGDGVVVSGPSYGAVVTAGADGTGSVVVVEETPGSRGSEGSEGEGGVETSVVATGDSRSAVTG